MADTKRSGLWKNTYEFHGPISYGGAAGTYLIGNPYGGSPCDYRVIAVSVGACSMILSAKNSWSGNVPTTAPAGITQASDGNGNGIDGYVFVSTANQISDVMGPWAAMPAQLYLGLSGTGFIIMDFRRPLERPPVPPITEVPPEFEHQANLLRSDAITQSMAETLLARQLSQKG